MNKKRTTSGTTAIKMYGETKARMKMRPTTMKNWLSMSLMCTGRATSTSSMSLEIIDNFVVKAGKSTWKIC